MPDGCGCGHYLWLRLSNYQGTKKAKMINFLCAMRGIRDRDSLAFSRRRQKSFYISGPKKGQKLEVPY